MPQDKTKPPLRFKKLRIAWSVFWGLAAVLLIVLWVRSYRYLDTCGLYGAPTSKTLASQNGVITASINEDDGRRRWGYHSQLAVDPPERGDLFNFAYYDDPKQKVKAVVFPHWPFLLLSTLSGTALWIKRYSVKGMLTATTLVAVVLGLRVWATR